MVYNVYIKRKGVAVMQQDFVKVEYSINRAELDVFRDMMVSKYSEKMATADLLGDLVRAERYLKRLQSWQTISEGALAQYLIAESVYDYMLRGVVE